MEQVESSVANGSYWSGIFDMIWFVGLE
ncbi:hypothetical protein G9444_0642 [Rhodococcus erythropolis]|uniref:Uncharacterized protein n=1 Tax=Rhodococcus erythropolis TaxID=1833 RepID=A0A6G9CMG7_RHOER|nr:hypothetical protein G9444_0642 [Rhodococcus erythropolis]